MKDIKRQSLINNECHIALAVSYKVKEHCAKWSPQYKTWYYESKAGEYLSNLQHFRQYNTKIVKRLIKLA